MNTAHSEIQASTNSTAQEARWPASVVIVESPSANLNSIYIALMRIQQQAEREMARPFKLQLSCNRQDILSAQRVIFPGVGHASYIMAELRSSGLDSVLQQVAQTGTPIMGICLGMQLLFEELSEGEPQSGLGLLPGRIRPLQDALKPGQMMDGKEKFSVPHMGWNAIAPLSSAHSRDSYALLVPKASPALSSASYFVHSYYLSPNPQTVATCHYGGVEISAIERGQGERSHIWGCQFHPEKSGAFGSQLLRNWLQNVG